MSKTRPFTPNRWCRPRCAAARWRSATCISGSSATAMAPWSQTIQTSARCGAGVWRSPAPRQAVSAVHVGGNAGADCVLRGTPLFKAACVQTTATARAGTGLLTVRLDHRARSRSRTCAPPLFMRHGPWRMNRVSSNDNARTTGIRSSSASIKASPYATTASLTAYQSRPIASATSDTVRA